MVFMKCAERLFFLLPCQSRAPNREALQVFVALSALVYTLHHTNVFCHRYVCVCVFFVGCFHTDVFLHLSVTTGAENGSSSQGTAGQSGLMAGSTGGVSKAAKGQGSAEKEEQTGNQKRARRQWESWSAEDKNSFFEGLYEVRVYMCVFMMRSKYSFFFFFPTDL